MLNDFIYDESVFKYLIWVIISVFGYFLAYINTKVNLSKGCYDVLTKYCGTEGKYFDGDHFDKSAKHWAYSFAYTYLLGSLHYYANVNTIIEFEWVNTLYILPIYITIISYSYLEKLYGKHDFSIETIKKLPIPSIVLICVSLMIFMADLCFHIYLSYLEKTIVWYLLFIIGVVCSIMVTYKIINKNYTEKVHIHPWFIGFIMGLLCRFNHPISIISYGVCYGLILEEAVIHGLNSIFDSN